MLYIVNKENTFIVSWCVYVYTGLIGMHILSPIFGLLKHEFVYWNFSVVKLRMIFYAQKKCKDCLRRLKLVTSSYHLITPASFIRVLIGQRLHERQFANYWCVKTNYFIVCTNVPFKSYFILFLDRSRARFLIVSRPIFIFLFKFRY